MFSTLKTCEQAPDVGERCDTDDFRSLCGKLLDLEKTAEGAPLVSVASGMEPSAREWQKQQDASEVVITLHDDDGAGNDHKTTAETNAGADEWEML